MTSTAQLLLIIAAAMIVIIVWISISDAGNKKRLRYLLRANFGKQSEREYGLEEFENIAHYYRKMKKAGFEIDDITWNDLDLDQLFRNVNNTQSSVGQEYLYYLLRKPEFDGKELKRRERLMDYVKTHEDERLRLQMALHQIGRTRTYSVSDYIELMKDYQPRSNIRHYASLILMLLAVGAVFVNTGVGFVALFVIMLFNVGTYFIENGRIEPYVQALKYVLRLLKGADLLGDEEILELQTELDAVRQIKDGFRKFRTGSALVVSANPVGGPEQAIIDYLRMVFHVDLIRFNQMMAQIRLKTEDINRLIKAIGYLDAVIAAASFRETLPYYSIPSLTSNKKAALELTDVYHPSLRSPTANSIIENGNVLLTGSNASGKSTFLKTVAINALFAQTFHLSFARKYSGNFFRIYTSMALRDNLLNSESYYIVEIRSLKRILDAVKTEAPLLCFIDEVLRGTNTVERIAASTEILRSINKTHVLCFAATHDIELTRLLEDCFHNYHFQEQISGNDISFDYRLRRGRATTRNAIKLLGMMGYDAPIIKRAEERTYQLEKL